MTVPEGRGPDDAVNVPAGAVHMTVAGEELLLLSERAVFWPRESTLLVADPHFGKAAAFRFAGLFVPPGTTAASLARLSRLLVMTGAARVVFLGDFLHAAEGRSEPMFRAVAAWRRSHGAIMMTLVRGNHDRRAGDPPREIGIEVVDGPLVRGPLALAHHPQVVEGHYVLSGHLHPCVTARGRGRGDRQRLPCFWFGRDTAVLPAFGEFTGCLEVAPREGDGVWVVAGTEVIALTPREERSRK
jgi:DNA ligase-associated metallophosphoesterase